MLFMYTVLTVNFVKNSCKNNIPLKKSVGLYESAVTKIVIIITKFIHRSWLRSFQDIIHLEMK